MPGYGHLIRAGFDKQLIIGVGIVKSSPDNTHEGLVVSLREGCWFGRQAVAQATHRNVIDGLIQCTADLQEPVGTSGQGTDHLLRKAVTSGAPTVDSGSGRKGEPERQPAGVAVPGEDSIRAGHAAANGDFLRHAVLNRHRLEPRIRAQDLSEAAIAAAGHERGEIVSRKDSAVLRLEVLPRHGVKAITIVPGLIEQRLQQCQRRAVIRPLLIAGVIGRELIGQ